MQDSYTTAVLELISSGKEVEAVLEGLKTVMEKKNHLKLYPSVLRSVARQLDVRNQGSTIVLARLDDESAKKAALAILAELDSTSSPTISEDVSLVGGFIAEGGHQRVDASYKRALHKLYQNITS